MKPKVPPVNSSAVKQAAAEQSRKKRRVTLYLGTDLYKQFSEYCDQDNVGISALIEELIKAYTADRESKPVEHPPSKRKKSNL